ncbi:MAG: hypothetical protein WC223_00760 [Bacteroidales bacterium]|jgi:hypothetical protein
MKKINAIDLDDTLLKTNSFKEYYLMFLFKSNFKIFLCLSFFGLLRKLNVINKSVFFVNLVYCCRKYKNYNIKILKLTENVLLKINQEVFTLIKNNIDENTICVICTNSPSDYVVNIAKYFNWEYLASELNNKTNEFIFMDGENKKKYLLNKYPKENYLYNFAVSDSSDDDVMLDLFSKSIKIEK